MDLFNTPPTEIAHIIDKFNNNEPTYQTCEKLAKKLSKYGYAFEYGLSAEPYNLRKVTDIEKDLNKFIDLFGESESNKITYKEYVNFWTKTPKELRQ